MKLFKKIVLITLLILVLVVGGTMYSITRGLSEGSQIVINEIDLSKISDGQYEGSYDAGRWSNEVLVEVSNHRITNIKITKPVTYENQEQSQRLIKEVMQKQSTSVDAMSGATVTSKAYLKSIENALTQAK